MALLRPNPSRDWQSRSGCAAGHLGFRRLSDNRDRLPVTERCGPYLRSSEQRLRPHLMNPRHTMMSSYCISPVSSKRALRALLIMRCDFQIATEPIRLTRGVQLRKERLGILEVRGVETFSERFVDFGEQRARLFAAIQVSQQPRKAGARA